ncbi:MAG TPA: PKD domain-containing protein, partial [Candidatus Thermoplasmatota archaeon]|nr:PKD domain-containing protein [Candidatus Thermoplasmatota archaeon]
GNYSLKLRLYNSTGRINDIVDSSSSVYNDTNSQSDHVHLYPRGDTTANKPDNITGPSEIRVFELANFSSRTTDSNQDQMQYQWNWSLYDLDNVGPYNSGQQCNISHMFVTLGLQMIQVRARDDYGFLFDGGVLNRYGNWSTWSNPFYIRVKLFVNFDMSCTTLSSAQNALSSTQLPSILNLNSMYDGFTYGGSGQQTFSWTFDSSFSRQAKTTQYSYSTIGRHTVTLNVTDGSGFSNAILKNITVTSLSASYNLSTSSFYTVPGDTIVFNDTSVVSSGRHMINWTWSFNDGNVSYTRNTTHSYDSLGVYNVTLTVKDNRSETDVSHKFITIDYDYDPPQILYVTHSPDVVGMGCNVTIAAIIADNSSGVNHVDVNITYPDNTTEAYAMTHVINDTYGIIFNNTWQNGVYKYGIWAVDNANNTNSLNGFNFTVTSNATISISTLKDSYSTNQYINITDPPNPSDNLMVVSRGLTWNTYYNASSGNDILELYTEPVNYQAENGSWTPINTTLCPISSNHHAYGYGYRLGNDRGLFGVYFKPNSQSDWPVAFTYNRSDNPTISVVRSKLLGVGYVDPQSNWAYKYLQTVQSSQGQTQDNAITYPGVFTGTNVTWSYGNTELKEAITISNVTKTMLQAHPPSSYGLHDASSYLVFITKLDYQALNLYNNSGMLTGNITISDTGVDLRDALGRFKCGLPLGDAYEFGNESVRQKLTYRIVHLNSDTYLLSGIQITDLSTMTFPVVIDPTLTVSSTTSDGYLYNSSNNYGAVHDVANGTVSSNAAYISIGQKKVSTFPQSYTVYRGFVFFNTSALPTNAYLDSALLSLYKKDDYSATDFNITIQSGEISGQQSGQPTYPHDPLQAGDYNQSHYLGNGGSLNTTNFVNGHNNITLTSLSWINKTGITKLCLRSSRDINRKTPTGNEYINVYSADALGGPAGCKPKLIITYRNQSKIKNTGSTSIKGYLLIQIQFYNTSQGKWLVDQDTVNEITPRTIIGGALLSLDNIFNGHVRASDLTQGTGTYRVYAAFRDPEGNILKTDSRVELNAWWQFGKV